jgi:hypothetical protein
MERVSFHDKEIDKTKFKQSWLVSREENGNRVTRALETNEFLKISKIKGTHVFHQISLQWYPKTYFAAP